MVSTMVLTFWRCSTQRLLCVARARADGCVHVRASVHVLLKGEPMVRGTRHVQVEGKGGFTKLVAKVRTSGPTVLYHGALAAAAATFVGHYPWFFTVRPADPLACSRFVDITCSVTC